MIFTVRATGAFIRSLALMAFGTFLVVMVSGEKTPIEAWVWWSFLVGAVTPITDAIRAGRGTP